MLKVGRAVFSRSLTLRVLVRVGGVSWGRCEGARRTAYTNALVYDTFGQPENVVK